MRQDNLTIYTSNLQQNLSASLVRNAPYFPLVYVISKQVSSKISNFNEVAPDNPAHFSYPSKSKIKLRLALIVWH